MGQEFHLFVLTEQCKQGKVFTYTKASSQLGPAQPFTMSPNMDTVDSAPPPVCVRELCAGVFGSIPQDLGVQLFLRVKQK